MKSQNQAAGQSNSGKSPKASQKKQPTSMRPWALEPLEERVVLSAEPLTAEIQARLNEYMQGDMGKLDTSLLRVYDDYTMMGDIDADDYTSAAPSDDGYVAIEASAKTNIDDLQSDLQSLGFIVDSVFARQIAGQLPIDALDELGSLDSLQTAWQQTLAIRHIGAATSQGVAAMRADVASATFGVDGSGIRVGVISDSYDSLNGAAMDVMTGDLPGAGNPNGFTDPVLVLADQAGTDEGRAMAQIVHDVAPGANLAFHTVGTSEAAFANAILNLNAANSQVIVDDITFLRQPMFQDGVVSQAVTSVVASGTSYFSSAGNRDSNSYESGFVDSGMSDVMVGGMTLTGDAHDFDPGPGVDIRQSIDVPANGTTRLTFQWDQPFGTFSPVGSQSNYDIHLVDTATGMVVASGTTDNIATGDPVEVIAFTNGPAATTLEVIITRVAGPDAGLMKYIIFGPGDISEFDTDSSTLQGHHNAAGTQSIAATFYQDTPVFGVDPPLLEDFSSFGQTPILFNTNTGARLATPEIRNNPDLSAPDGVDTTFFGVPDIDGTGFPNFFGTSAAAPHAAAVAALMLNLDPTLSPDQLYDIQRMSTIDINPVGFDNGSGFGFLQADLALANIPQTILVTPRNDFNFVGDSHTVTAIPINALGNPIAGVVVTFDVTGAHTLTGTDTTDIMGEATFTYVGTTNGSDLISVSTALADGSAMKQWFFPASIGGEIYIDGDADSMRDPNELGIPGALIQLTGSDVTGSTINIFAFSDDDGDYNFTQLFPGDYNINLINPAAYISGDVIVGNLGGTANVGAELITDITINEGDVGTGYIFTQLALEFEFVTKRLLLASTGDFVVPGTPAFVPNGVDAQTAAAIEAAQPGITASVAIDRVISAPAYDGPTSSLTSSLTPLVFEPVFETSHLSTPASDDSTPVVTSSLFESETSTVEALSTGTDRGDSHYGSHSELEADTTVLQDETVENIETDVALEDVEEPTDHAVPVEQAMAMDTATKKRDEKQAA